jgi:RNA polymerase II subunit A small phosphatase-like protein
MFEIGFWTTGSQAYADLIVNAILPPSCSARFVWAVDRCSLLYDEEFGEHVFLKDLRQVEYQGFDLQNVLVVDDRPQALTNVHGNLLRVRPFHGDREDIELYLLSRYLRETDEAGDFQGLGKRDWRSMDSKLPGRKS